MELRESSSRLPPPNPAMPYREDCWSEGATSALIDAWGDRYLELNRGNLRQKDWQEVADTVNSRRGGVRRPSRTDSQCKNRIDTLKKKYKAEKARISDSGGVIASQWPFYPRLDVLIGNSPSITSKKTPSPSPPLALPLPSHRKPATAALPAARPVESKRPVLAVSDSFQRNYSAAAAAAAAAAAEGDSMSSASSSRERSRSSPERSPPALVAAPAPVPRHVKRLRPDCEDEKGGEDGVRQLARAIERFAEIYEKVEEGKHQQMMELERKRIEFTKGLEFQRMQIFVDSQVQLEKIKRARGPDAGEQGSSAALSLLLQPCFFNV